MRLYGWTRKVLYAIVFFALSSYCLFKLLIREPCSDNFTKQTIKQLCEHYKSRDVNGNLCQALCEADTLLYVKCLNLNKGKIVFLAKCLKPNCNKYHDINIVMKYKNKKHEQNKDHETVSANKTLEYYLDRGFPGFWFTDDGHWSNAGLKQIYRKINKQSHFILGEDDLTNLLTSNDVKSHQLADNLQRHKDEISLLVQDEYVFTKMFAGPVFVPNLYGSCGHFYAVEYTPSKSMIGSKFSKISHWKERARVALAIFHIVDSLDTMFVEPLEFCDIKESNFGTASGAYGSLKIIDSDMIWFESVLHADLVQCYCTKDEDCDINDCHGSCNLITNQCRPYRKNNNLQAVCRNLFLGTIENLYNGLLRDPPSGIASELNTLMEHCAYPSRHNTDGSERVTSEIKQRLYKLLKMSKSNS